MAAPTLTDLRRARVEANKRLLMQHTQADVAKLIAAAQAKAQDEDLSFGEQLLQEAEKRAEKSRKETQQRAEKARAQQGQAQERDPGLGEPSNPEPIIQPPTTLQPTRPEAGPTLSPAPVTNYGEPGGPQPGSPGQQAGATTQNYQVGGTKVDPYLMATAVRSGREQLMPGVLIPSREVTTTIRPNVLSAYEGATLDQQQQELQSREQIAQQQLQLERNKSYITSFTDLAPEVGPELAGLIAQASANGDIDRVNLLARMIPDTATGRLIKNKIRTESARQASAYASAGASRASAVNSYASAANTQDQRVDRSLEPLAKALANPEALSPEQYSQVQQAVTALPDAARARLSELSLGVATTPLSTVGKTAADLDVSIAPGGNLSDEERVALVKQTADRSTKIDLGLPRATEAKVDEQQLVAARSRDSLARARALFDPKMAGLKGRTAAELAAFARDKNGLPIIPTAANFGAQWLLDASPKGVEQFMDQRNKLTAAAGLEMANVIHQLYGAALTPQEDKRASKFTVELESGDPQRIMAVMGEAEIYANMKLASYAHWNKIAGKAGKPWDTPDSRVIESMATTFDEEYQKLTTANPQLSPNAAKAAALQRVERFYGVSDGMGFKLMQEYGYGR